MELAALEFPDPPFADLIDRNRDQVVQLLAAMPEGGDEVASSRIARCLVTACRVMARPSQIRSGLSVAGVKPVQQRPPRNIGQRLEDFIHGSIIGNQMVACQSVFFRTGFACYRASANAEMVLNRLGWNRMKSRAFVSRRFRSFRACGGAHAQQQVIGAPPEASNMKLVGYSDLQARSAYQPTIHHQGDR